MQRAYFMLKSEKHISTEDYEKRLYLANQLRLLPIEAFTRLQYFQPQIGCFNKCAICSQDSSRNVWQFTKQGLKNFFAAISAVAKEKLGEKSSLVGTERVDHRPSVIYPYVDNDIASYAHFDDYIKYLSEDLGGRVRISTVGYSSLNTNLQKMHEKIVKEYSHAIAGVRFSFSPYPIGWRSTHKDLFVSREQFVRDFANTLQTYYQVINKIGTGQDSACVVFRLKPHIATFDTQLNDTFIDNHHVLCIGPHLLVREQPGTNELPISSIKAVKNNIPVFDYAPVSYILTTSDTEIEKGNWKLLVKKLISSGMLKKGFTRKVDLYCVTNYDGIYYAVDPSFHQNGTFSTLSIYPKTKTRQVSGYLDSTRFLLNSLLYYKHQKGIKRREPFPHATQADVENVLEIIKNNGDELRKTDIRLSCYVLQELYPLIQSYITAIYLAGYSPSFFFDPKFTVDTGRIVNQGRARNLFKRLVSQDGEFMTPHEERAYGAISKMAKRGTAWRIAPMPFANSNLKSNTSNIGRKNKIFDEMTVLVQELDPHHLLPRDKETGKELREYIIKGVDLEHINLSDGQKLMAYPGINRN